jgi:hypothetical protein
MDLHDFGSLIWAIFILIAVISSVLRSARRTVSSARQQQPQRQPQQQPAQQLRQQPIAPPARQLVPQAPPVRVYVPPPVPVSTSVPRWRSDERLQGATSQVRARSRAARIFGRGDAMTRGIIALEVLGPPRALRDWSAGFPN